MLNQDSQNFKSYKILIAYSVRHNSRIILIFNYVASLMSVSLCAGFLIWAQALARVLSAVPLKDTYFRQCLSLLRCIMGTGNLLGQPCKMLGVTSDGLQFIWEINIYPSWLMLENLGYVLAVWISLVSGCKESHVQQPGANGFCIPASGLCPLLAQQGSEAF